MLYLYFQTVCDDVEEGSPSGSARNLVRKAAGLASHMGVTSGTRYAIAAALSESLAQSQFMSKVIAEKLAGRIPFAVFVAQVYGIEQKAAMAARGLKALEPAYYWILYQAKLEMLYYFIEPVLSGIIKKVKLGAFDNLDELTNEIKEKYDV